MNGDRFYSKGPRRLHIVQEDGVICMWYWLFINQSNSFIVLSEEQLRDEGRWNLEEENFELISDSFKSIPAAEDYAHEYYGAKKSDYECVQSH